MPNQGDTRLLSYAEAIREAIDQEMGRDRSVRVFGINVDDHRGFFKTLLGLPVKYGPERVWGTPLSEDALMGFAIGDAMAGGRPILAHERFEYVLLGANQLINVAAKTSYMFGGTTAVPLVIRAVIGRGWGQGAQHSQGLHSLFAHIPGLRVAIPSTPYDAKGLLIEAIRDPNPVLFVEHRLLHAVKGYVPEISYTVPFGQARVLRFGRDITIVGISHMAVECVRAAGLLASVGIEAEIIDPVTLAPLDAGTIRASVAKTRYLLVVDSSWTAYGAGAEILALVAEHEAGSPLKMRRMGFPPAPTPPSKPLENLYYPNQATIAKVAFSMLRKDQSWEPLMETAPEVVEFRGPF